MSRSARWRRFPLWSNSGLVCAFTLVVLSPGTASAQDQPVLYAAGKAIRSFIADQFGSGAVTLRPHVLEATPAERWTDESYATLHESLGLPRPEPLPAVEIIRSCFAWTCGGPETIMVWVSRPQHTDDRARVAAQIKYSPGRISGTAPHAGSTFALVIQLSRDSAGSWVVESVVAEAEAKTMVGS